MREESLNFLKTLVNTPSPVSHEAPGQRVTDAGGQHAAAVRDELHGDLFYQVADLRPSARVECFAQACESTHNLVMPSCREQLRRR